MPNTYAYIDQTGQKKTIQADNPDMAIGAAPDIAPTSGVQLIKDTKPLDPPKISSSNMPKDDVSSNIAKDTGTKELYPDSRDTGSIETDPINDPVTSAYLDMMNESNEDYKNMISNFVTQSDEIADRIYDVELAREDYQYKSSMDKLKRNEKKAVQAATANAIALNPYSQSRGAQTAQNFNNAIKTEYERLGQDITQKYRMAREALAAGRAETAFKLRQSAQQQLAQANEKFQTQLFDIYKQSKQEERLELEQESQFQDDFIEAIQELPLGDIDNLDPSSLSRINELGKRLGMSEDEIANYVIQYTQLSGSEREREAMKDNLDIKYKEAQIDNVYSQINDRSDEDEDDTTKVIDTQEAKRIEELYGFTPPIGIPLNQVEKYIQDNPYATPVQLQDGINQAFGGEKPAEFITKDWFMENYTDDELKDLADDAGVSGFWSGKDTDIKNYIKHIMSEVQLDREAGYTDNEIIEFLGLKKPEEDEEEVTE